MMYAESIAIGDVQVARWSRRLVSWSGTALEVEREREVIARAPYESVVGPAPERAGQAGLVHRPLSRTRAGDDRRHDGGRRLRWHSAEPGKRDRTHQPCSRAARA